MEQYPLLDQIQSPKDLKGLDNQELNDLAQEIREFLISHVSKTGGHLSSNLGVVELTLALYSVFGHKDDKIVWDVGHQTYVQKILTGRRDRFDFLRQEGGMSGFTRRYESPYDLFNSGHASNSISLAYGLAKARDLRKQKGQVIAVIGDGALTGGEAFEALNNAGRGESKIIIILNDNEMSISRNTGRLTQVLGHIRTKKIYRKTKTDVTRFLLHIPYKGPVIYRKLRTLKRRIKYFLLDGVLFEELGFTYLGPIDGHDIKALKKIMQQAEKLDESVVIHVKTVKGKGYPYAEKNPSLYHGISAFDPKTGSYLHPQKTTWSDAFGRQMMKLARKDQRICAVSAAMVDGTGLSSFNRYYPERLFDVGIAEGHAVTFAAGLARGGMKPVVAIYSTFLQRAYDQISADVCLNRLPVVIAVDRAGIVGDDGESHQGIFDIAYLSHLPGMTIMAPADDRELRNMLTYAVASDFPCAIRYPRGEALTDVVPETGIEYGRSQLLQDGTDACVIALGPCVKEALKAAEDLKAEGLRVAVVNARFALPVDQALIKTLAERLPLIVTVEEHVRTGGFGERVRDALPEDTTCRLVQIALPDVFIKQGKREKLLDDYGLTSRGIKAVIRKQVGKNG